MLNGNHLEGSVATSAPGAWLPPKDTRASELSLMVYFRVREGGSSENLVSIVS